MAKKHKSKNRAGVTAILVTVVLIAVVSLIVIGFSEVWRSNKRQALDVQLGNQALFAAESGIEEARSVILPMLQKNMHVTAKTDCKADANYGTLKGEVSKDDGVVYTCVLIDPEPETLVYDLAAGTNSTVIPVKTSAPKIDKLQLTWSPVGTGSQASAISCPAKQDSNPVAANWANCPHAMLRIDLVPVGSSFNREDLMADNFTAFLMPGSGGGNEIKYATGSNILSGAANQGAKLVVSCGDKCTANIVGLDGNSYYMRVQSWYKDAKLVIKSTVSGAKLKDAQVLIDVTGRAQDVLKREQARVSVINHDSLYADTAISTNKNLCKTFWVFPSDDYDNTLCK